VKCFRQSAQIDDLFLLCVGGVPEDTDARCRFALLRARSNRPSCQRATKKRDELAPSEGKKTAVISTVNGDANAAMFIIQTEFFQMQLESAATDKSPRNASTWAGRVGSNYRLSARSFRGAPTFTEGRHGLFDTTALPERSLRR
jgi:hypothetical protein